jgi:hypothetical protein
LLALALVIAESASWVASSHCSAGSGCNRINSVLSVKENQILICN